MQSEDIKIMLWQYAEGTLSAAEIEHVQQLLETSSKWQAEYAAIKELHAALTDTSLAEQPSMRFTKNIMEAIATQAIQKPLSRYTNPLIIKGLAGFFVVALVSLLAYTLSGINWHTPGKPANISMPYKELSIVVYASITVIIISTLLMLDTLLRKKSFGPR